MSAFALSLRKLPFIGAIVGIVCIAAAAALVRPVSAQHTTSGRWSTKEQATMRSLSIAALEPLAPDPSNRYADHKGAMALGRDLFFDTRFSANGRVSCATCHLPEKDFQDSRALAEGVGRTGRRTMPIAGTARAPWLFWDGRAGSQWEQALGPLESAVEHGGTRTQYAHLVAAHYRQRYEAVFGPLPSLAGLPAQAGPVDNVAARAAWLRIPEPRRDDVSRVYANIGKAIAAYERTIDHGASRFDRYVATELAARPHDSTSAFSRDEEAGLRLFMGKGNCINCHSGPLLTDDHFHNIGVALTSTGPDSGRTTGVRKAIAGEFSCTSRYSDARSDQCDELRFVTAEGPDLLRAFKSPSLRNVAERAPYMHAGQITTLEAVVEHYSKAPAAPFGTSEIKPLRLSAKEQGQIVAFLRTLSGPITTPLGYAPGAPSHP